MQKGEVAENNVKMESFPPQPRKKKLRQLNIQVPTRRQNRRSGWHSKTATVYPLSSPPPPPPPPSFFPACLLFVARALISIRSAAAAAASPHTNHQPTNQSREGMKKGWTKNQHHPLGQGWKGPTTTKASFCVCEGVKAFFTSPIFKRGGYQPFCSTSSSYSGQCLPPTAAVYKILTDVPLIPA